MLANITAKHTQPSVSLTSDIGLNTGAKGHNKHYPKTIDRTKGYERSLSKVKAHENLGDNLHEALRQIWK